MKYIQGKIVAIILLSSIIIGYVDLIYADSSLSDHIIGNLIQLIMTVYSISLAGIGMVLSRLAGLSSDLNTKGGFSDTKKSIKVYFVELTVCFILSVLVFLGYSISIDVKLVVGVLGVVALFILFYVVHMLYDMVITLLSVTFGNLD